MVISAAGMAICLLYMEKPDMEKYSRYGRKSIDDRTKNVLCFRQRIPLSGNLLSDFPRHR